MKNLISTALCVLALAGAHAQTAGTAFKYLDINRVNAGLTGCGDMHFDLFGSGNPSYEVPKGSATHSSFAACIWIGGMDAGNALHMAGQTYRQSGNDFWPGPLDTTNATTSSPVVAAYDKIWKVSYTDINAFITQYNLGNVPTSYTPTPDMVSWPAQGTGAYTRDMAPFVDVNGDGVYNWQNGDYPKIKGDQALYYIFNDAAGVHSETGGTPLGIEVHAMAYAYGCPTTLNGRNELAYTTFYDYKVYNRSATTYTNVYLGFWNDVDLGCYLDDYIGCSVQNNLGFTYNANGTDQVSCGGVAAYGNYPPAIGSTVLKGPLAPAVDGKDNNNDGTIDEPGEQCLMNKYTFYNNNIGSFPPQTTNPSMASEYYGYLRAIWKDGSPFTCGGNAYGGSLPTDYVFPWTSYPGDPCASWSETSAGNLAGDRRYILSTGAFNLGAKQMVEMEYAYVWSVDSSSANQNIGSVNKLITDVGKVRTFYAGTAPNCLLSITLSVKDEKEPSSKLVLYPNPSQNIINIKAEHDIKSVEVIDISGRSILASNNIDKKETELNVQELANGVYFVKVSGNDWSNTRKLIKN